MPGGGSDAVALDGDAAAALTCSSPPSA